MFFLFESPLKKNEGFEKKKLQEQIPVVFHLHNLLDSVFSKKQTQSTAL